MTIKNDLLLKVLNNQSVDRTPVWIMRQAGRYLPEYKKIRAEVGNFLDMCKNPEIAAEITLMPLKRYSLDAAIVFSDILTIPDAMGLGLEFIEGVGPKLLTKANTEEIITKIPIPDPYEDLGFVLDAITSAKKLLDNEVPLIGFSGSPWTLAAYMIEGGSSKDFYHSKKMAYENPALLNTLLSKLSKSIEAYLRAQVKAGADVIMLFDSWGGILSSTAFLKYSLRFMNEIFNNLHDINVPKIVFTKGGNNWLEEISELKVNGIGIDWTINIGDAKKRIKASQALQGNMDPIVLHSTSAAIEDEVKNILQSFGSGTGHIFNLGHGITPNTPTENVETLISAVNAHSRSYHER